MRQNNKTKGQDKTTRGQTSQDKTIQNMKASLAFINVETLQSESVNSSTEPLELQRRKQKSAKAPFILCDWPLKDLMSGCTAYMSI